MFHVSDQYGKFYLYVQTPFVRQFVSHASFKSAAAAEAALADLVRNRADDIRATIDLYETLEKFQSSMRNVYENISIPLDDRADAAQQVKLEALAAVKAAEETHDIIGDPKKTFLVSEVNDTAYNYYNRARRRMEEMEDKKPASFDEALQVAASRAEASLKEGSSQTRLEREI